MDKEKLDSLIELLKQTEKKDRNAIVAKAAADYGLKFKDVMKLIIEAGYDLKAEPQKNPQSDTPDNPQAGPKDPPPNSPADPGSKKIPVVLRHKTDYPGYRRAGLVLTQKAETHEVTEEQLAVLKKDPWVEIVEDKGDGKQQ
jgi:hypothetical protein